MKKQAPRWYYHFVSINKGLIQKKHDIYNCTHYLPLINGGITMLLEIYKALIQKKVPFWFDQFFFAKDINYPLVMSK